jgi:hypothetical protein
LAEELKAALESKNKHVGNICQTLNDADKTQTVYLGPIYVAHVRATQELDARVTALRARILALQAQEANAGK